MVTEKKVRDSKEHRRFTLLSFLSLIKSFPVKKRDDCVKSVSLKGKAAACEENEIFDSISAGIKGDEVLRSRGLFC